MSPHFDTYVCMYVCEYIYIHTHSYIHSAATLIKSEGVSFDVAFTSVLERAIKTTYLILEDLGIMWIPTFCKVYIYIYKFIYKSMCYHILTT